MNLHQRQPRKIMSAREVAEAVFAKRAAPVAAPRILEDAPKPVVVETKRRRSPATSVDHAVVAAVAAAGGGGGMPPEESEHQKVYRLISEGDVNAAARLAARLINSGNTSPFFVYGGRPAYRASRQWFDAVIESTQEGFVNPLVDVGPELAQIFLENNAGNRKVDPRNLADIMRDIMDGRWKPNGETIIISKNGDLNDGQHRNFACLLTGGTYRTVVSFGAERESMATVDIGKKRTGADRLGLKSEPDYVVASAIAALMFQVDNGRKGSQSELDAYFEDHKEEIRAANRAKGSNIVRVGPSPAGAAAVILMRLGAKENDVHEFMATVRKNEGTRSGNSARALHQALYPIGNAKPLKLSRMAYVSALCHHFVAWKRNQKVSSAFVNMPIPESL